MKFTAIILGAAAITALFIFGANMMLDGVDKKKGKDNKQPKAPTESAYTIHNAFEDNGM